VVTASATGLTSVSFGLTNTAGTVSSIAVYSGSSQTAKVGVVFGLPLRVVARDANLNVVSGVVVTFTAPVSGARAALSAGTATTGNDGTAQVTATAGTTAGSYVVTASATGLTSVSFGLTNTL